MEEGEGRPGAVFATFEDGRRVRARVLFADPREDLALLRLAAPAPAEGYATARLGSSEELAVGQEVFAIGNPFGLGHTVSRGIVSAVDRTRVLRNPALPVLQLDAAINVGNSGGPLFNLDGELVGIVTARVSDTPLGKAEGIAFALPIDHVRAFLRAVSEDGIQRSGMIGLQGSALVRPPPEVRALGYRTGILVEGVYRGYPAHAAGLRRGDVIVALRGKRLDALAGSRRPEAVLDALQQSVRALFPGETLAVTVVRDGAPMNFALEVAAARPAEQAKLDAEALFGILLADGTDVPTIAGPGPRAMAHRRFARRIRRLRGARIVDVMGRKVERLEDLAEVCTEIRDLLERSGGQLRVAVTVESRGGRRVRWVIPVLGS
ncbi:MAG: PDZ domain-containing protein [Deltaproteobacteria bacterium]|nr:MAG: PDZ domain-containing protein [Deltaproteobacteria bacterium]